MRAVAKGLGLAMAAVCLFLGAVPSSQGYNLSHLIFLVLAAGLGVLSQHVGKTGSKTER
jgi:hypothetical protein